MKYLCWLVALLNWVAWKIHAIIVLVLGLPVTVIIFKLFDSPQEPRLLDFERSWTAITTHWFKEWHTLFWADVPWPKL